MRHCDQERRLRRGEATTAERFDMTVDFILYYSALQAEGMSCTALTPILRDFSEVMGVRDAR